MAGRLVPDVAVYDGLITNGDVGSGREYARNSSPAGLGVGAGVSPHGARVAERHPHRELSPVVGHFLNGQAGRRLERWGFGRDARLFFLLFQRPHLQFALGNPR